MLQHASSAVGFPGPVHKVFFRLPALARRVPLCMLCNACWLLRKSAVDARSENRVGVVWWCLGGVERKLRFRLDTHPHAKYLYLPPKTLRLQGYGTECCPFAHS